MNNDTTAEKTIEILRSLFSRFGLPNQIVSDNGPQFISGVSIINSVLTTESAEH